MSPLAITLGLLLASQAPASDAEPPLERTHTIAGEIVRLDLARGRLVLKLSKPPREYEVVVDSATTRIVSQGRVLRLEDVRTGVRGFVVCEDDTQGRHVARLVRVGARAPSRR